MVILLLVKAVPAASPLQLVKTYWVLAFAALVPVGRIAKAVEPESYHPAPVEEPLLEFTVR